MGARLHSEHVFDNSHTQAGGGGSAKATALMPYSNAPPGTSSLAHPGAPKVFY